MCSIHQVSTEISRVRVLVVTVLCYNTFDAGLNIAACSLMNSYVGWCLLLLPDMRCVSSSLDASEQRLERRACKSGTVLTSLATITGA